MINYKVVFYYRNSDVAYGFVVEAKNEKHAFMKFWNRLPIYRDDWIINYKTIKIVNICVYF